jgi:hypothetical protein
MEVAKVHEAMTKAQGRRDEAAEALGVPLAELVRTIAAHRELAALWRDQPGELTAAQAYERTKPAFGPDIDPKAVALADAFDRQEGKLRQLDWEGLGIKDRETLSLMQRFEGFAGGGLNRTLDSMYGGMCFCFAKMSQRFAHAAEKLEDPVVKASPEQTAYWHALFMDYAREMQKFNKEATNAGHTRLLIADKAKKLKSASERLRRPAWAQARKVAAHG